MTPPPSSIDSTAARHGRAHERRPQTAAHVLHAVSGLVEQLVLQEHAGKRRRKRRHRVVAGADFADPQERNEVGQVRQRPEKGQALDARPDGVDDPRYDADERREEDA